MLLRVRVSSIRVGSLCRQGWHRDLQSYNIVLRRSPRARLRRNQIVWFSVDGFVLDTKISPLHLRWLYSSSKLKWIQIGSKLTKLQFRSGRFSRRSATSKGTAGIVKALTFHVFHFMPSEVSQRCYKRLFLSWLRPHDSCTGNYLFDFPSRAVATFQPIQHLSLRARHLGPFKSPEDTAPWQQKTPAFQKLHTANLASLVSASAIPSWGQ